MGRRRVRIRIRRTDKGAVSPAVAFAVLVLVLAVALVAFAVFESDDTEGRPAPSPAGTPTEEDLSLTDAEAIERFKELDRLRIDALEGRTLALLRKLYTRDSPALRRGEKSIRQLRRTDVRVDERWRLEDVSVAANSSEEIKIEAVGVSAARFFDATGNDVTRTSPRERQTVECLLRLEAGAWVIHDCLVTAVDAL